MTTAHLNGSYANGREAVALPPAIPPRRVPSSPPRTRLLGELLVREGLVTETQLASALRAQEASPDGTPIGQLLVEQGALSPADLEAVLRRYHKKYRLGDILVETNVISETQLQLAVDHHRRTGLRLGDALLQLGFVNEEMLKLALCTQLDVAFVDLDRFSIDRTLGALVPKNFAQQHRVLPVARVDNVLTLALADPTDGWVAENLEAMTAATCGWSCRPTRPSSAPSPACTGRTPESGSPASTSGSSRRTRSSRASTRRRSARWASCASRTRSSSGSRGSCCGRPPSRPSQQSEQERQLAELQAAHAALREEHEARGAVRTRICRGPRRRRSTASPRSGASTAGCWASTRIWGASSSRSGSEAASSLGAWSSWRPRTSSGGGSSTSAWRPSRRSTRHTRRPRTPWPASGPSTRSCAASTSGSPRELRERCHTAEGRQQLAVQQLETLLSRLRQ